MIHSISLFFFSMGGAGLLLLGILDSSFLFFPFGNDLLMVALTARNPERMLYYAAMAVSGSTLGVAATHWASSASGHKVLEDWRGRRLTYVRDKVSRHGGLAIALATLMPPPFPFTMVIGVAAALEYPLGKMLAIVAACRTARFLLEGWLAIQYGRQVIRMARSPYFRNIVIAISIVSIVGSVFSLVRWVRKSRTAKAA
jgi:membrane protein YqaA with SNARE-associated domain